MPVTAAVMSTASTAPPTTRRREWSPAAFRHLLEHRTPVALRPLHRCLNFSGVLPKICDLRAESAFHPHQAETRSGAQAAK